MKIKITLAELYKIIEEEYQLMNGNGSAWGLPGNWASKVVPAEEVEEGRSISYSDVRQEYDAILGFLKKDILQKQGSKYVADALEMLANDVRDGLHNPDPYDKENWAYFDKESGSQPNLKEEDRIDENALVDFATLEFLWKNLKVPGVISDFFDSKGNKSVNDKIDDWFKNNMGNPLVRGLYKSMMLMGSPPDRYRHDKNWEKEQRQAKEMEEHVRHYVAKFINEKAKSKSQQRFFGMVTKCREEGDCASPEIEKAAKSMKKSDVEDFAKTKHDGLPNKVEKKDE